MAQCPECLASIDILLKKLYSGEIIICQECESQLEVISLEPLMLALAPEIEEDWGE